MSSPSLKELALVFLRLGATAFGGPAAHIALMEDELVHRRKWLPQQEFVDLLGAANIIPGPTSTEMAIHIGFRQRGLAGLLVAGLCFIVPSALFAAVLAVMYLRLGNVSIWTGALYGIKPVVLAIIVQALWRLGRTVLTSWSMAGIALAAALLRLGGVNELIVLFGGGLVAFLLGSPHFKKKHIGGAAGAVAGLSWLVSGKLAAAAAVQPAAAAMTSAALPGAGKLFLIFLKIGSVLFGSGYVLLAFLRADFVERTHWVTEQQLLDATAVGQVTPGPVSTTATFLGYLLAGPWGAAAATAGMFLPAFFFVWVTAPWIQAMRRSPTTSRFLDGLNVASVALMAAVTLQLARGAVLDIPSLILLGASTWLVFQGHISPGWLAIGGAVCGAILALLQMSPAT